MGFLQRLGHHSGVRHLKILAVKPAGLLGPRLLEDRQRFLEALATLIARHVEALEVQGDCAPADAELQSALAENVHRGCILGRA